MIVWTRLLVGAMTFLAAHLVIVARWHAWFEGADAAGGNPPYAPWFMNSTSAVAFTVVSFVLVNLVVSLVGARHRPDQAAIGACYVAAGAVAVMTIVLFTYPGGPGNLFPIALTIGAALITVSSVAGAMAAWLFTKAPLARSAQK
jgi:hypothetical protein